MLKNLNLFPKLLSVFFNSCIIPTLILSTIFFSIAKSSLEQQAFYELDAVREIKAGAIKRYFTVSENQINALATDPFVVDTLAEMTETYDSLLDTYDNS